jgi:DNA polymerase Ligase (LigD)
MQDHLIESASHSTGSMLIWDTGEYSTLPYREPQEIQLSSSEGSDKLEPINSERTFSESEKLHEAFRHRKIRLRLHGTRLPPNYTISLHLSKDNLHIDQPGRPKRRRKKLDPQLVRAQTQTTSDSEDENDAFDPKYTSYSSWEGYPEILPTQCFTSCSRSPKKRSHLAP